VDILANKRLNRDGAWPNGGMKYFSEKASGTAVSKISYPKCYRIERFVFFSSQLAHESTTPADIT
jgi:hypothetical protein